MRADWGAALASAVEFRQEERWISNRSQLETGHKHPVSDRIAQKKWRAGIFLSCKDHASRHNASPTISPASAIAA